HIVWLELLIHPTAMLVFQDPPPAGRMAPANREGRARFFGRRAWRAIVITGLAVTAAVLLAHGVGDETAQAPDQGRTMALATLIIAGATMTAILSGLRSGAARIITGVSVASLALLVQVPQLAAKVHLRPLSLTEWTLAIAAGVLSGSLCL